MAERVSVSPKRRIVRAFACRLVISSALVVSHSVLNVLNVSRHLPEFTGFQSCAGNVQDSVGTLVCVDVVAHHRLQDLKAFVEPVVIEPEFFENAVDLSVVFDSDVQISTDSFGAYRGVIRKLAD